MSRETAMPMSASTEPSELSQIGVEMYDLVRELYPICRSLTGNGFRATLARLQRLIPLTVHEVPSGTQVFDWTIPYEWNIRDAYVKGPGGRKLIDFQKSSLHVVSYSVPVRQVMPLAELKPHLHTLPEHPAWIPYRTSYYKPTWGFCLSHQDYLALPEGDYEVCIDSTLAPGHLTYGEYYLPGESQDEILLSCHACHPSLCNDNLSGVALVAHLAARLAAAPHRYSYRCLFLPGTIGAITWLCLNEERVSRIKHVLVAACVGDGGPFTYKRSRQGDAEIDRAVAHVLLTGGREHTLLDFSPYGYDERQYCSPGFDLPAGSLTRTPHGRYPEYHTSADNLDLVQPGYLADSFATYLAVLQLLEQNRTYLNRNPKCEPQLGRRGLYQAIGGTTHQATAELALLWTLNLADGTRSLLDIADRAGLPFSHIQEAAELLLEHDLLKDCGEAAHPA